MWKMNIILYLYVKFCELLKTDKKNILYKLSKYLYEAFILRKSLL